MSEKAESTDKKPKSRSKLLPIIAALVVLGGGGGGFFWWKGQQAAKAEAKGASTETGNGAHGENGGAEAAEISGALAFEPFIVNLADAGGSRYLKADIRLLLTGVENMKELQEDQVVTLRIRSAILERLSQQASEQVVTPEGKEALKKEIATRAGAILHGHAKVVDVLFNEFVVQF